MEFNKLKKDLQIDIPTNTKEKKCNKKIGTNSEKDTRFIQTNYYLNDYNYYTKNNLKMSKLREKQIKQYKQTLYNDKQNNLMPKMLYFNKFINNEPKSDLNITPNNNIKKHIVTIKSVAKAKNEEYKKIEQAIINKSIEQKSKRHIKKTIKAFDDLLQCVEGFKIKNKEKGINLLLNSDKNNDKENKDDNEDDINFENYNFDEYKKQYKKEKMKLKDNINKTADELESKNLLNDIDIQINEHFLNNNINNINDNEQHIYITAEKYNNKNKSNNINIINNNSIEQINNKNVEKNNINNSKKYLTINNMILISDESLENQIKKLRKNFKKDLYFNINNYGKFKFTEPGLNYPHSFDKNKKFPEYKGNDLEEKKMFTYKSKVTNPRYNYNNIGTFNEKFNKDLSQISNFYGKEKSKGRFLRNPLISMFSKYIPNYELYKNLKLIENRYTSGNKYKFGLKPIINKSKNNFDRLASNVYNREHKAGYFE